jgi:hypothetical protein
MYYSPFQNIEFSHVFKNVREYKRETKKNHVFKEIEENVLHKSLCHSL